METSPANPIKLKCECGATLKVPASVIGRKVKCPKCQRTFVAEDGGSIGIAPLESTQSGGRSELEELAQAERAATRKPSAVGASATTSCMLCHKPMPADAVLCVSCGYDARSGRRLGKAKTSTSIRSKLSKLSGIMGTFPMGCLLCAVGVAIGIGIWVAFAVMTGREIGWIAWGVGVLAGAGMLFGYQDSTDRAGVVAACMTIVGVLVAKAFVFIFVVYSMVTGDTEKLPFLRLYVHQQLTQKELDGRGVWDPAEREAQSEAAWEAVEKRVNTMSEAEVRQLAKQFRDDEARYDERLTETGFARSKLVSHEADLQAEAEGLAWNDDRRGKIWDRLDQKRRSLSEVEVGAQSTQLDAWMKEGRWADESYVQNHLAYALIADQLQTTPPKELEDQVKDLLDPDEMDIPEEVWTRLHADAVSKVKPMSHDQRVVELKRIEQENDDGNMRARLAYHFTERLAGQAGLSRRDSEARDPIRKEQERKFADYSHEQLVSDISLLDAWEKEGKWSDAPYLRQHLIDALADDAIDKRRQSEHARTEQQPSAEGEDDDRYWMPSSEEEKAFHRAAVAEVDAMPQAQHAQRIRDLEANDALKWNQQQSQADAKETRRVASGLAKAFFQSLLVPINALFLFLAIGSAFRIAARGFGGD